MRPDLDSLKRKTPRSLRTRLVLGVAVPVFLALSILSVGHYWREGQLIEEQVRLTAVHLGEVTLGSLRHVMLEKDQAHLDQIVDDVARMKDVQQVMIVNPAGEVFSKDEDGPGTTFNRSDLGCVECHSVEPSGRARSTFLISEPNILRITTPINNSPECQSCHMHEDGHLGMLLIDVSMIDTRQNVLSDLQNDLLISSGLTLLITVMVYLLMNRLVINRFRSLQAPISALAQGEFSARLPISESSPDEIDTLATHVNQMAGQLEQHVHEQEQRHELKYNAIKEERERIAREIHDGVAQFVGYVNHKVNAILLLLHDGKTVDAETQLKQLSEASHDMFVELRADILGLRMSDLGKKGFEETLAEYAHRFSDLSGIEVDFHTNLNGESLEISPTSELHLLRITQEALANSYKHARTKQAWVSLARRDHTLELTIGDDGRGFDPSHIPADQKPHFGLNTMRERAEAMGAEFQVDSVPGAGTRITVRVPKNGVD
jgi:signal transduction histidine kinase